MFFQYGQAATDRADGCVKAERAYHHEGAALH
jgi:hypothetical protein